ncbi:MAG: hypothetical protein QNL62_08450 [Gammaproteobacteria bacterium]|nr:hypothetical protein [Gammaproteobacteria bacterium]
MKLYFFTYILLAVFSQAFAIEDLPAQEVQNIYEYQNSQGVTEFTDTIKTDKAVVNQLQIKKKTPEEEAQSKAKLEQLMEKDKELDKRLSLERQLEDERHLRRQNDRELEKMKKEQSANSKDNNSNNGDTLWIGPPRIRPPNRPVKPRPRPLPAK